MPRLFALALGLVPLLLPFAAQAQSADADSPRRPSLQTLESIIETRDPETRIEAVDHDRISARRIDIVDEDGTIRMTLAAETPAPIIDGIQYRRAFGVSGLILYDEKGSERGGFGVADVDGGMAVLALDHPAMDAIGWRDRDPHKADRGRRRHAGRGARGQAGPDPGADDGDRGRLWRHRVPERRGRGDPRPRAGG